jgi:hypothetical protein
MSYHGKLTAVSYPVARPAPAGGVRQPTPPGAAQAAEGGLARLVRPVLRLKEAYLAFPAVRHAPAERPPRGPGRTDGGGGRPGAGTRTTSAGPRHCSSQAARRRAPLPLNPLPWRGREPRVVSGMPKGGEFLAMAPPRQRGAMRRRRMPFIYRNPAPHIGGIVMASRPAPAAIPG